MSQTTTMEGYSESRTANAAEAFNDMVEQAVAETVQFVPVSDEEMASSWNYGFDKSDPFARGKGVWAHAGV